MGVGYPPIVVVTRGMGGQNIGFTQMVGAFFTMVSMDAKWWLYLIYNGAHGRTMVVAYFLNGVNGSPLVCT